MAEAALASCAYCPWQARISGDDMVDIVVSLRKILIQHVQDAHPDRCTGGQHAIIYRTVTEGPTE